MKHSKIIFFLLFLTYQGKIMRTSALVWTFFLWHVFLKIAQHFFLGQSETFCYIFRVKYSAMMYRTLAARDALNEQVRQCYYSYMKLSRDITYFIQEVDLKINQCWNLFMHVYNCFLPSYKFVSVTITCNKLPYLISTLNVFSI